MTSSLVIRKDSHEVLTAFPCMYLETEFIGEQPSTKSTNTHFIEIWLGGVVHGEELLLVETNVYRDFTGAATLFYIILVDAATNI